MMTALWFVGGLILTLIGLTCLVGAIIPRDHVATGTVLINAPRAEVWRTIRSVESVPSWRPSVKTVDGIERSGARATRWTEHAKDGSLTFILDEEKEPTQAVTRIDDAKLPFGGTWTIELADEKSGTRVRVTERGFIKLPPMRAMAAIFMDFRASLKSYLTDLAAKHGSSAAPIEP